MLRVTEMSSIDNGTNTPSVCDFSRSSEEEEFSAMKTKKKLVPRSKPPILLSRFSEMRAAEMQFEVNVEKERSHSAAKLEEEVSLK